MRKNGIVPLSQNVLAGLTVEELEQRLEMQMLSIPDADWCLINRPPSCGCFGSYDCASLGIDPFSS